jgi:BlaI family transcriptional regulator, penicillinase repressor
MRPNPHERLSGRERQIMEVIYERGQASAAEVMDGLPQPPSYSAVRALLRILEEKGHLKHKEEGAKYIYLPTHPRENAGRQALAQVMRVFYGGSVENAMAALLDVSETRLKPKEAQRLRRIIEQARKEGR